MSVEIEVGLENAARAPKIEEELPLEEEAPKGFGNPKTKRMLFGAGAAVLAALTGLFFYYHNRETTDDAQVDGSISGRKSLAPMSRVTGLTWPGCWRMKVRAAASCAPAYGYWW